MEQVTAAAPRSDTSALFPPMPLQAWAGTKETLHRFLQIAGKLRLDNAPPHNHWWHVPFHLTGRGLTSRPMGEQRIFAVDFDLVDHRLVVNSSTGDTVSFPLPGLSVAAFYERLRAALAALDIRFSIHPVPFGLPDSTPFPEDTAHASYDQAWVNRYWLVLSQVALMLEEFAGRSYAKTSPVHHFWHSLDLAVARFSDKRVEPLDTVDAVTREAYSHEIISFGFWFGDDNVPEPAFYSYTAPEPEGLTDEALRPAQASWRKSGSGQLALLRYDDARAAADPRGPCWTSSKVRTRLAPGGPGGTPSSCAARTLRPFADQPAVPSTTAADGVTTAERPIGAARSGRLTRTASGRWPPAVCSPPDRPPDPVAGAAD